MLTAFVKLADFMVRIDRHLIRQRPGTKSCVIQEEIFSGSWFFIFNRRSFYRKLGLLRWIVNVHISPVLRKVCGSRFREYSNDCRLCKHTTLTHIGSNLSYSPILSQWFFPHF